MLRLFRYINLTLVFLLFLCCIRKKMESKQFLFPLKIRRPRPLFLSYLVANYSGLDSVGSIKFIEKACKGRSSQEKIEGSKEFKK